MGTVSTYQLHDLSSCLTEALYQFLLIHYLFSLNQGQVGKSAVSALQGQMLRCALQCNFVIKIYPSYITHIALHQKDAEFIYLGRGPSIKFISKQHGRSWKRLLLLLCVPSREKRWTLPQLYWAEESKQFLSCHNLNQQKTVMWWWLHFGSVYVLVTSLLQNSSAKLICSYQSTQWHK